jgi:hypothetical protein
MSSTITPTTAAPIQDLTNSLLQRYDANQDGKFSLDEFSTFLTAFMRTMTGISTTATAGSSTGGAAAGVTTPALFSSGVSTSASRLNDPLPPCPPGWNAEKWANAEHQSVKYVAGRIMARYSPADWVNETTREQILADFRAAGLNPTASGRDKCDFNDGAGAIDIVQSASTGGKAWQWLPVSAA